MPRVKKIAKRRNDYSETERYQLLTGMLPYPGSTRFGGPAFRVPVDVGEVQLAWLAIGDELMAEFQHDKYTKYRERHNGRPWAVRVMSEANHE